MHVGLFLALGLLAAPATGDQAPVAWSPDGTWLAYCASSSSNTVPSDWFYGGTQPAKPPVPELAAASYRLLVTAPGGEQAMVLQRSDRPMTAPGWRPDGQALAVGRLIEMAGRPALEVVAIEGMHSKRVVATLPLVSAADMASPLIREAVTWSADGRLLTVPGPRIGGFSILRADNGRVVRSVDRGSWPAWAPDGTRLAYVEPGETPSLWVLDARLGAPRQVATLNQVSQGPSWSRDGHGLWIVNHNPAAEVRRFGPRALLDLIRFDAETGEREVTRLITGSPRRDVGWRGAWWSLDRDAENLFYAVDAAGEAAAIVWYRPRTDETLNRFHPVDTGLRIGGVSLSPSGRHVAIRFGPPEGAGPVGVWQTETRTFTPLAPDADARRDWVVLFTEVATGLIRRSLPAALPIDPATRPTVIPRPGEIPAEQELLVRLRQVSNRGRALTEIAPSDVLDPASRRFLLEARLLFEEATGRHGEAGETLDALEPLVTSADERLRLLALRGQIVLGQGEFERAADVADYLKESGARRATRIEWTAAGPVLTESKGGAAAWGTSLEREVAKVRESSRREPGAPRGRRPSVGVSPPGRRDSEIPAVEFPRPARPPAPGDAPVRPPF